MSKLLENRLAAVEQRIRPPKQTLQVVTIKGGLPGPLGYAKGGGKFWQRGINESYESFEQRVIADAKTASLKTVVIGGLPPSCLDLGSLEDFLSRFSFPEIPPESDR